MRRLAFALFAAVVVLGCGSPPAASMQTEPPKVPASGSAKEPPKAPIKVALNVDNGTYSVEFDDAGSGNDGPKLNTTSGKDGKQMRYEVTWAGGKRRLVIENDMLTVDGESHGKIARGQKVRVDAAGEIHVTGP